MSKQKLSLQEQLLKSGLVSTAKAKAVKTEQRKNTQQQRKNNIPITDEARLLAEKAKAEKAGKDRELNQKKMRQEAQKQLAAQIRQLVGLNRLPDDPDGEPYHFTDQNKVKTIYVSESLRGQLMEGGVAIVKSDQLYAVVPVDTAEKIRARCPACLILLNSKPDGHKDQNDPYAVYQVPDDLMW